MAHVGVALAALVPGLPLLVALQALRHVGPERAWRPFRIVLDSWQVTHVSWARACVLCEKMISSRAGSPVCTATVAQAAMTPRTAMAMRLIGDSG